MKFFVKTDILPSRSFQRNSGRADPVADAAVRKEWHGLDVSTAPLPHNGERSTGWDRFDAIKPVMQRLYESVKSGNRAQISIDSNSQPDYRNKLNKYQLKKRDVADGCHRSHKLRPENN